MNGGWNRKRYAVMFGLLALVTVVESRTVLPSTESIPYSLLLIKGGPGTKGDYVNVRIPGSHVGRSEPTLTLTKRIACVGGELLRFENGGHYCGETFLGKVLDRSVHGAITPFVWNGPVPAGKAYVVGTHVRSYDSRYFGFVDLAATERLIPLF